MAVIAFSLVRNMVTTNRISGNTCRFRCDTEAELPATNVIDGDTAYTLDTKKLFDRASGAWVEVGDASNTGGGDPPEAHKASHQNGGADEMSVAGLSGLLADAQTPAAHSHAQGDVTNLTTDLTAKQASSEKGAANGYASLDGGTKVPIAQVPTGSTGSTACIGNDARLSDARTPLAHAASHKSAGGDPIKLNEFANPDASVQFNQQQALQFRVENRTSDPSTPAAGEIWLRTDL